MCYCESLVILVNIRLGIWSVTAKSRILLSVLLKHFLFVFIIFYWITKVCHLVHYIKVIPR